MCLYMSPLFQSRLKYGLKALPFVQSHVQWASKLGFDILIKHTNIEGSASNFYICTLFVKAKLQILSRCALI